MLRRRRNVYGFSSQDIPQNILVRILENARHVPSAGFTQDFDLVVVRDRATKKRLGEAAGQGEYEKMEGVVPGFIENAPVVVVPCGNKTRFEAKYGKPGEKNSRLPWWLIDVAFASLVLILSALQEGIAASFIGAVDDDKMAEALDLPRDGSVTPLAIIPLGYKHLKEFVGSERMSRAMNLRKKPEEQIHWNKW